MPSTFPTTNDTFNIPSNPSSVNLSDAGTGSRNHPQHHQDLGDAIMAIEANVALLNHDHSGGTGARSTQKLVQANTHQSADTDAAAASLHHTLGTGASQAAAGNHAHSYEVLAIPTNDANGWGVWTNIVCPAGFGVPPDGQYPPAFPKGVKVKRHVSGIVCITGMWNINSGNNLAVGSKILQLPTDANGNKSWAPSTGLGAAFQCKTAVNNNSGTYYNPSGVTSVYVLPDGGIYADSPPPTSFIYLCGTWSAL